ncbi:MAG: hypothetical protein ACK4LQ_05755 [Pararhodobacter sp.]
MTALTLTQLAPGLGAITRKATRRLTMILAAGAVALTGIAASATPARSDTGDDLLRLFLGIAAVAVVVRAIDDSRRPPTDLGRWTLPDACLETVRVRGRTVDVYNARCLQRAGLHGLPHRCETQMRTDRGPRRGFVAQCLYEVGYRPERGSVRPGPSRPGPRPQAHLPRHCEMTYRQHGMRVDGYDGACLRDAGLRNLPRQCRVSDRSGRHYFNADCLNDAGYRRSRR